MTAVTWPGDQQASDRDNPVVSAFKEGGKSGMATKSKIVFKPLGNRIVIEPLESDEQVSTGGIYIPDTAKEKPQDGTVVAVGPGRLTDDGKRVPLEVAVGDTVVYSKYSGTEYKDADHEYLIVREDDILFKK
jgi:chaperonin GroES